MEEKAFALLKHLGTLYRNGHRNSFDSFEYSGYSKEAVQLLSDYGYLTIHNDIIASISLTDIVLECL